MARILRFVDYEYSKTGGVSGDILLDINDGTDYCMDIEYDIPSPAIEWVDPAHLNGRDVSRFKYPNIEAHITGHVYGTDKADLSTNIRALFERFNSSNPILEWRPDGWTDSLYIDLISPPIDISPPDWFEAKIRDNPFINVLANTDITCEAKPFGRGPEETIVIAQHLGTNESFQSWTGPLLDDFTIVTAGGGTVTKNVVNDLDGGECVQLDTAGGGADSAAIVDTNLIPVDEDDSFTLRIHALRLSANAVAFDVDVACYNDVPALLGTLNMLVGDNVTNVAYEDPVELSLQDGGGHQYTGGVVSPSSEVAEPFPFPVGTTQVKRTFRNDSAVASSMVIDCAYFSQSSYFNIAAMDADETFDEFIHKQSDPATIEIPPDAVRGDVPTPFRLITDDSVLPNEQTNCGYFGIKHNDLPGAIFVYIPNTTGLVETNEIGMFNQSFITDTAIAPIVVELVPTQNVSEIMKGRYLPVVKVRGHVAGSVTSRFEITTDAAGTGNIQDVTFEGNNLWVMSGFTTGANQYHESFAPVDVPVVKSCPTIEREGGTPEFYLYYGTDDYAGVIAFDIDFLMLIPLDGFGKVHFSHPLDDICIEQGLYYRDGDRLVDLTESVGEWGTYLDPNKYNQIACLFTSALQEYLVMPYYNFDLSITYFPLYLLVPEE